MPDHPSNRPNVDSLGTLFAHHPPGEEEKIAYAEIRDRGAHLAEAILHHCPPCADTTAAVRKVREAVMTAHAAIALDPGADSPAAV